MIVHTLDGTTEAPHFDRVAFKVRRTYATLAADRKSLNIKFSPDEQEFKCLLKPAAFSALHNSWGRQGWTRAILDSLEVEELRAALTMAWEHGRAARTRKQT